MTVPQGVVGDCLPWGIHASRALDIEQEEPLLPESCLQADWSEDYASLRSGVMSTGQ